MKLLYILKDGKPVAEPDTMKWAMWFEDSDADRLVAQTQVDDTLVSTVFLGIAYFGNLLYETRLFSGESTEVCGRYATWEEAEEGHKAAYSALLQGDEEE